MKEAQPVISIDRKVFNQEWAKGKIERHVDNLAHFTGFWHGTYFLNGVAQKAGNDEKNQGIKVGD